MNKTTLFKTFMRLFAAVLCFTFIAVYSTVIIGASISELSKNSWHEKIDGELWDVMETKSDSEIIPVYLWLDESDITKSVKESLRNQSFDPDIYESETRFNKEILPTIANDLMRAEDSSTKANTEELKNAVYETKEYYFKLKRNTIRKEYTNFNSSFVNNFFNNKSRKIIYLSNYTSTLIIETTKAEIEEYAKNPLVEGISLYIDEEQVSADDVSLTQIAADSVVGTKSTRYNAETGYKGRNVKIGIIEVGQLYDPECPQLKPLVDSGRLTYTNIKEITVSNKTDHATMVTCILLGQAVTVNGVTYEGVAPMAEATLIPIVSQSDVLDAITWFINNGYLIINYSGGNANGSEYDNYDKEVDRLTKNANVIFVGAAGNIKRDKQGNMIVNTDCIYSPGKAYNAITVGNAYTKTPENGLNAPYKMLSSSSYIEKEQLTNKPDIVAPGCNIPYVESSGIVETKTGTSCSAPIVSGVIAQMLEANPSLKHYGATMVKSILLAGAEYSKLDGDRDNSVYDYCIDDYLVGLYLKEISGAGLVNAVNAVNIAKGINSFTTEDIFTSTHLSNTQSMGVFYPGEKIRMVLTFFNSNTDEDNQLEELDDLDLYLIKSSTNEMQTRSISSYNNVEIVEFVVPNNGSGEYEYQVLCDSINSTYIPASLTWMKWRPGDVNSDGIADNLDSTLILQYDSGTRELTPEQLFSADVNKDGVVDNIDSNLIMQYDSGANVVLQ